MPGMGIGRAMLERLHKVLANAGVASRRRCEQLILGGQVTVDGRVVTQLGTKVDLDKNKVAFAGQFIRPPKPVTLVLHKPRTKKSSAPIGTMDSTSTCFDM